MCVCNQNRFRYPQHLCGFHVLEAMCWAFKVRVGTIYLVTLCHCPAFDFRGKNQVNQSRFWFLLLFFRCFSKCKTSTEIIHEVWYLWSMLQHTRSRRGKQFARASLCITSHRQRERTKKTNVVCMRVRDLSACMQSRACVRDTNVPERHLFLLSVYLSVRYVFIGDLDGKRGNWVDR